MPQASEDLRQRWGIEDRKAKEQLEGKIDTASLAIGYIEFLPGAVPTDEDLSAAQFLVEEWDYAMVPRDEGDEEEGEGDGKEY